jgi:hypothetical protein
LPAGLLLWLAPAAGRPPANDGLPKRWAGTTDVYVKTIPPLRTHTVVTFTLSTKELQVGRTVYSYRPTGTIDVAQTAGSDGRCTFTRGARRLAIPSQRGVLVVTVAKLPNGRRKVTYSGHGDALGLTGPLTIACPELTTNTTTDEGAWLNIGPDRTIQATAKILQGTYSYPDGSGVWKHCLARNAKDAESCKAEELQAIASTTGAVRGGTVTLDGSKSKKDITSYTWELAPGADCPSGTTLRTTTLTGAKVSFTLLCSLEATLTVSDGGDEDSTTIEVPVRPRPSKTPFARRSVDGGPGAPTALPSSSCVSGTCTASIDGGLNLPDCPGTPQPGSAIICPLLSGASTWLDHGYTLATVADPKGPFDGFSYVASSTLEVKRVELINANLLPGGARERDGNTFYGFNKAKGADVDGFIAAIRQHEGLGAPGRPQTGHSRIIQADLQASTGDPRRQIEKLIAPAASDVQKQADEALRDLDTTIDGNSADPLPTIWTGTLWFWDDYAGLWRSGAISVPGP